MLTELSELANQRQVDLERERLEARKASSDSLALQTILSALEEVREEISRSVVDEVSVSNLDEVKAHLHNELGRVLKPIISAIESIKFPEITTKFPDAIKVANLAEIAPKDIVINLDDLKSSLNDVLLAIQSLKLNPSINVESPTVNVPESKVDVKFHEFPKFPEIDIDGILKALEPLKFISDRPNKPISVRISSKDGKKFLDVLENIKESSEKQVAAFSQGNGLNKNQLRAVQQETSGISLPKFDYVSRTLSAATQETYVFKTGGSGGTTVSTVVVNYTDSTLATISDVTRT